MVFWKYFRKYLELIEKSSTFASAFAQNRALGDLGKSSLSCFHNRQSSTRSTASYIYVAEVSEPPVFVAGGHLWQYSQSPCASIILYRTRGSGRELFLQWRVWSWLRMNASYRLNTCKSRGSMEFACKLWWRPAHGWVTRIQPSP